MLFFLFLFLSFPSSDICRVFCLSVSSIFQCHFFNIRANVQVGIKIEKKKSERASDYKRATARCAMGRERSVMIWAVQSAPSCREGEPDKGIIGVGVWAKKSGKGSM